jgi:hypothetical protein
MADMMARAFSDLIARGGDIGLIARAAADTTSLVLPAHLP